ncbi:MAG: hypothetical protein CMK09_00325 [Ponticaulis sp.]|nr:hypothetical protein [Ponticaulis sp.]|tara:strand:- start:68 stop:2644 length:2577 start_codon:yes stop_codon:yes gene_type:complete
MKKFIVGAAAVVLVLIIGLCVLPFLIPSSTYARVAENKLEEALGRDVTLGSDTRITILPNLGARITSVEIANAEGFDDPYFAKAEALNVAVKWLPLLTQKVEIASLKFEGADVLLQQKSATENNWTFTPVTEPTDEDTETTPTEAPAFDAVVPKAELINSRLVFRDDVSEQTYRVDPINLTARLEGLDAPAQLNGDITVNDLKFDIAARVSSLMALGGPEPVTTEFQIDSDPADVSFNGTVLLGEIPEIDGAFKADLRDAEQLITFANLEIEQDLSLLGTLSAEGKIAGPLDQLKLEGVKAQQNGPSSKARFEGDMALTETPAINGRLEFDTDQLGNILKALAIEPAQDLNSLGDISVTANLSGTPENIRATDLNARVEGRNLTASMLGEASYANGRPVVSGQVKANSSNLRRLFTDLGVELTAPSDDAFKSFNADLTLSPARTQTLAEINALTLDELSLEGSASVELSNEIPEISANLNMIKADLSPYLADSPAPSQNSNAPQKWSDEPVDLSALKLVNGDVELFIGELTDGRAIVRDLKITGDLQNGTFNGTLSSAEPEGGRSGTPSSLEPLYNGSMAVATRVSTLDDGSSTIRATSQGSGIATAALIKMFTGMDVLQGVASLDAEIQTSGMSVASYVRNLDGNYQADIVDGAIFGINLPQLVRAAQDFLSAGQLPSALSPSEKTDFSSLSIRGGITKGIANIETFQLQAPYVRANASGTIDLVNRTLDIRILPRAVTTAEGQSSEATLNGFGIPLKVFGNWTSVSGSLDTEFITDLARRAATDKISDELRSRVGGDLGSVLDSALGIKREQSPPESAPNTPEVAETPDAEDSSEEAEPEDIAKSLLRDLITRPRD